MEKIKTLYGVEIPEALQDKPERAKQYVAGYLHKEELPNDELRALHERFTHYEPRDNGLLRNAFDLGVLHRIQPRSDKENQKSQRGGQNKGEGREPDLVELIEKVGRNPGYIPNWAWKCYHETTPSDFSYHFSKFEGEQL